MKTTFMFPLLGLFVEKQMRRFRITVRLYKSELSAGSRSYGAIKKGATSVSSPSFTTLPAKKSSAAWHMRRWSCTYGRGKRGKSLMIRYRANIRAARRNFGGGAWQSCGRK